MRDGLHRIGSALPALAAACVGLAVGSALAQVPLLPEEVERVDVIAIERDDRDVFAFDAVTGARATERLELDETVVFEASRGRIALLLTDRRVLAIASGGGFQTQRFGVHETPPEVALVESRIALLATNRRALAFDASGSWAEAPLTPSERVEALRAGDAVGLVATNRRLLGAGVGLGGLRDEALGVRESIESVNARSTILSVRTDRRIAVFSGLRGVWTSQRTRRD